METYHESETAGLRIRDVGASSFYANPVVIANIVTYAGEQPAHVRLRNVESRSFQLQVEEWEYQDGNHGAEEIHYIVLESGVYELPENTKVEVNTIHTDRNFATASFSSDFRATPAILSQSQTSNERQAIVSRQSNANASGFSLKIEEEEGGDGWHVVEVLGYVAIEQKE